MAPLIELKENEPSHKIPFGSTFPSLKLRFGFSGWLMVVRGSMLVGCGLSPSHVTIVKVLPMVTRNFSGWFLMGIMIETNEPSEAEIENFRVTGAEFIKINFWVEIFF